MKKKGNVFKDGFMALPRIALAILIAVVIAKPLELKIFDTEIRAELISMEQERFKEHEDLLKLRYEDDIAAANEKISSLKSEIVGKQNALVELNAAAVAEADGTGGSMKRNLGPIYNAKKALAESAAIELQSTQERVQPLIDDKQSELMALNDARNADLKSLDKVALTGFAARLEALDRLSQKSGIIAMASLFIMLLFIAIETAPIFVKLISGRSPYDFCTQ